MLKVAKKYLLVFDANKKTDIANLMAQEGCFEITDAPFAEQEQQKEALQYLQQAEYQLAVLDFAIGYLAPFAPKTSLLAKMKNPKIIFGKSGFVGKEKIFRDAKRIEKIEKKLDILLKEKNDIFRHLSELEKFEGLAFLPQDTEHCFFCLISIDKTQTEKLCSVLQENNCYQKPLGGEMARQFFLIGGLKKQKEDILNSLKECKGEILSYNYEKIPSQQKSELQSRLSQIEKTILALQEELKIKAKNLEQFKVCRDVFAIEKANWEIKNKILSQGFLNYIVFWGYKEKIGVLQKKIASIDPSIQILELSLEPTEEPRVSLHNNRFVRPFQYVTEIFGMPRAGELDPTPYLALFFILFFGVCLTDAGYGILLIVFTALPLLFFKKMFDDNKLFALLFYGGISTLLMGILFGSYFGSTTQTLQKFPLLYKLKKIDPIEDTVLFMMLSFGVGYLQVAFAQVVKIISAQKNKNKEMFLQGLAWLIFYISLVLFIISQIKIRSLKEVALGCLIGAAGFLMFSESLGQKIFLRPLVGAIKILQGIIGTMSDVLSYSRLVALGLATAVIALIVNQIAFLLGKMVPYVGWIFTALILAGGHIFNLGINALGAFIHSGRLQFVEFFPKFLEGGGKRFQPLKPELKYTKVT